MRPRMYAARVYLDIAPQARQDRWQVGEHDVCAQERRSQPHHPESGSNLDGPHAAQRLQRGATCRAVAAT